ncbi:Septum formation initiator [Arcanobacterium haemolyticum]|uniref:FtsB family cell division protein n=1 Tax=Arcanobacterium haemolyticum TaxID=28264 RepID=UPI000D9D96C5|nr:septum formation initiator family protein [Arcanobacterium haemolyticum]SPT75871.1 Septum formation initiator [Arcanobacterium haemolyticum]
MVRRPPQRSSGTPGPRRVPAQQPVRRTKPSTPVNKPGRKARPASSSPRKNETSSRKRFTREHHLVIERQDKTHRISLRLATVVLFALVGVLIVANPLTQYLAQQEDIRKAKSELSLMKERVESLTEEKELWEDPTYVQAKARERLGFVMPGQTLYSTKDPKQGDANDQLTARAEEVNRLRRQQTPFFVTGWDSIVIAGQVGERENPQNTPLLNENLPHKPQESGDSPTTKDAKK